MDDHFTLLLLSQYYPVLQQFQIISSNDISVDADIAEFMQSAEQHVNQQVLENVYRYASVAVR
jgi:hypothetical protein